MRAGECVERWGVCAASAWHGVERFLCNSDAEAPCASSSIWRCGEGGGGGEASREHEEHGRSLTPQRQQRRSDNHHQERTLGMQGRGEGKRAAGRGSSATAPPAKAQHLTAPDAEVELEHYTRGEQGGDEKATAGGGQQRMGRGNQDARQRTTEGMRTHSTHTTLTHDTNQSDAEEDGAGRRRTTTA